MAKVTKGKESKMAYQAKCNNCKQHYQWEDNFPFRKKNEIAVCPQCNKRLMKTSHQCTYPKIKIPPIYRKQKKAVR